MSNSIRRRVKYVFAALAAMLASLDAMAVAFLVPALILVAASFAAYMMTNASSTTGMRYDDPSYQTASGSAPVPGSPTPPPQKITNRGCTYAKVPETSAIITDKNLEAYPHKMDQIVVRMNGSDAKHYIPVNATRLEADLMLRPGSLLKVDTVLGADVFWIVEPLPGRINSIIQPTPVLLSAVEMARMIDLAFLHSEQRSTDDGGCGYDFIEPDWILDLEQDGEFSNNTKEQARQWNLDPVRIPKRIQGDSSSDDSSDDDSSDSGPSEPTQGAGFASAPDIGFEGAWERFSKYHGEKADVLVAVIDQKFPLFQNSPNLYFRTYNARTNSEIIPYCSTYEAAEGSIECWHGEAITSILSSPNERGSLMAGALGIGTNMGARFGVLAIAYNSDGADLPYKNYKKYHEQPFMTGVIASMLYAIGSGKFHNPTPVQVINLSLGTLAPCSNLFMRAMSDVDAKGAIVVASAGNHPVPGFIRPEESPASCPGVISATMHDRWGKRKGYPGSEKAIRAPGAGVPVQMRNAAGAAVIGLQSGTSASAPHIAATIALMKSIKPGLNASCVQQILQQGPQKHSELGDWIYHYLDAAKAVTDTINLVQARPSRGGPRNSNNPCCCVF